MRQNTLSCLVLVTAFLFSFKADSARAQLTPVPHLFIVSADAHGPNIEWACQAATAELRNRCTLLGPVTALPGTCIPLFTPSWDFLGWDCYCKVQTTMCWNPPRL